MTHKVCAMKMIYRINNKNSNSNTNSNESFRANFCRFNSQSGMVYQNIFSNGKARKDFYSNFSAYCNNICVNISSVLSNFVLQWKVWGEYEYSEAKMMDVMMNSMEKPLEVIVFFCFFFQISFCCGWCFWLVQFYFLLHVYSRWTVSSFSLMPCTQNKVAIRKKVLTANDGIVRYTIAVTREKKQ